MRLRRLHLCSHGIPPDFLDISTLAPSLSGPLLIVAASRPTRRANALRLFRAAQNKKDSHAPNSRRLCPENPNENTDLNQASIPMHEAYLPTANELQPNPLAIVTVRIVDILPIAALG